MLNKLKNKILVIVIISLCFNSTFTYARLYGENNNINPWVKKIDNKLDDISNYFVDSVVKDSLQNDEYEGLENWEIEKIQKKKQILASLSQVKVDSDVIFGKFYISSSSFCEPLEWIVVEKNDDDILLTTKYIIDNVVYDKKYDGVNWENSSVRKYLNEYFFEKAFSEEEKELIVLSTVSNIANKIYGTDCGNDTMDKVYLIDFDEINKYVLTKQYSRAFGTKYAINKGLWVAHYDYLKDSSVYWLRSMGASNNHASYLNASGTIDAFGDPVGMDGNGIRPTIRVKIK